MRRLLQSPPGGSPGSLNPHTPRFDLLPCADCASFLQEVPLGEAYQLGFNTLACRSLHTHMLPLRPAVHCPHIGPTGGDACYDKIYAETVSGDPFTGPPFIPADILAIATA